MNPALLRLTAALLVLAFGNLACYNAYRITTDELERLSSQYIAESATVQGTRGGQTGDVEVSATSPVIIRTSAGERHSITPFNFTVTDSQFIAPDYDLLLQRDVITEARVSEFAPAKTAILISSIALAAVGSFVLLTILADDED